MPRTPPDPVWVEVRRRRVQRGWSQERLGAAAGVAPYLVSRLERGVHGSRVSTLRRVLNALGCTLAVVPTDKPTYEPTYPTEE